MRMRPIFSTSRSQSDAKKPDDDWQEQFFKLDVKYIISEQVRACWLSASRRTRLAVGFARNNISVVQLYHSRQIGTRVVAAWFCMFQYASLLPAR